MISNSIYNIMKRKYAKVSSWAIWDENDYTDTNIIERSLSELNPSNIFIGLNASIDASNGYWRAFHYRHRGGSDYKLMQSYNNSVYRGAYMTDIFKDFIEPDSKKVLRVLREKPALAEPHIDNFINEIRNLGVERPNIFVFGEIVWKIFNDYPQLSNLNVKKLRHFAARNV